MLKALNMESIHITGANQGQQRVELIVRASIVSMPAKMPALDSVRGNACIK
jgi:hypothetical protein